MAASFLTYSVATALYVKCISYQFHQSKDIPLDLSNFSIDIGNIHQRYFTQVNQFFVNPIIPFHKDFSVPGITVVEPHVYTWPTL